MARKETIEDVLKFCNDIGLECKSTTYINSKEKMVFVCSNCNEDFNKTYIEVKQKKKNTCPTCNRKANKLNVSKKENSFKELLELCVELGVKCLSKEYKNNNSDLEFECTRCKEPFFRRWTVLRNTRSTICTGCSISDSADKRRYSYEDVKTIFEEANCTLFSQVYTSNKQKLEYKCDCGNTSTIALSNFMMGQRCGDCAITKRADSKRTPYEEVKEVFISAGCELLSETFIHSNIPLKYLCNCGNESTIKLPAFKRGVRCRVCAGNNPEIFENVKEFFALNECKLISTYYKNNSQKLEYICTCNEVVETTYYNYKKSMYHKCKKCTDKLNSGENHPSWNSELTAEERENRRDIYGYAQWRSSVYERDNYSCQCCRESKDLNAHHLDGYHWNKKRRLDVSNGVTLCSFHHNLLHSIYGYKNNTEEQFDEYLINYRKEEFHG